MIWVFALAAFCNAALLFVLEPMFSKLVLPLLGGTPAVWNTCLVFFQLALLLGYLYAHLSVRWLGLRRQVLLHAALLVGSLAALPVAVAAGWTPPDRWPVPWLLGLLSVSIGIPFTLLATGAPLLQRWLAGSAPTRSPYVLYAASNLGSLAALLAYPFLIEPTLSLTAQRSTFTATYALNAALLVACAAVAWWRDRGPAEASHAPTDAMDREPRAPDWRERLRWLLLSAVPSSLLMAVTTFLTTDVASVPLLWVMPLGLYLLTFVIAFSDSVFARLRWAVKVQPYLIATFVLVWYLGSALPARVSLPLHLTVFFVTALVCHTELARHRPGARHLTEYYVWISVGGLVGGIAVALVAPLVLRQAIEYPLAIVAAVALRPRTDDGAHAGKRQRRARLGLLVPLLLLAAFVALDRTRAAIGPAPSTDFRLAAAAAVCAILGSFALSERPARYALALGAVVLLTAGTRGRGTPDARVEHTARSFFGVHRVIRQHTAAGDVRLLLHGTTLHGAQWIDAARRDVPLTYYGAAGPLGDLLQQWRTAKDEGEVPRRVGIVGLGAGSIACHLKGAARLTYFEIDREVVRIARDPRFFTFLRDCAPDADVVLGDARLTLARQRGTAFDLLVLDAFSSDAVPVHLVTLEAMRLYVARLAPHGVLAMHVSNRHVDLVPVVANVARAAGLVGLVGLDPGPDSAAGFPPRSSSTWIALARDPLDLGRLAQHPRWRALRADAAQRVWTDDYSDLVGALR